MSELLRVGLTDKEHADVSEIVALLDEAYKHYFDNSDGHCKASEGWVGISFDYGTYFERKPSMSVEVYSYVLGPSRSHHFSTIAEALSAVRQWHKAEMAYDHAADAGGW